MKRTCLIFKLIMICFLSIRSDGFASEQKLPVIEGKATVATVNDEPITLEEFNRTIAASHAGRSEDKKVGRIDYSAIMNRMINTRLILLEARNMGLHELSQIKKMVNKDSRETLMELLLEEYVKDIKPDENKVEGLYKEIVKEWKMTLVGFEKEDAAKKFEDKIKAGNKFEETVKKAVDEGIANEVEEGKYLKDKELTVPIARLISKMEIGSVSPIVSVGKKGFVIFKLEGVRFPEDEDKEARERARRQALNQERVQAVEDYYENLRERYVKINEELLESLDYESEEPGLEKLLKDERVIAEISGERAVTVGELSKALKEKFYHGVAMAIESKRVNKKKREVLEGILEKRILLKVALEQGIDKSEEYKYRVKEYEKSVIFGAFINKVITPDIKLEVNELKTYYKKNREEYTLPEMMRIKSIVFEKRNDAVNALEKLIKGTDFNWLSYNAGGRVDENGQGLLKFEGKLLTLRSLPKDVRKAVSGANPGDFRLYESHEGYFYVLYIYHLVPAEAQPFEDVREEIAKEVFNEKVKKAVEEYADKLREYYPVKIYAKDLK